MEVAIGVARERAMGAVPPQQDGEPSHRSPRRLEPRDFGTRLAPANIVPGYAYGPL